MYIPPLRDTTVQLLDQQSGLIGGYAIVWRNIDNTGRFTACQWSDIKWDDKTYLGWCHVAMMRGSVLTLKKDTTGIQITAQLDEISDQYASMIQAGFMGYSCNFVDYDLTSDKFMIRGYLSEVSLTFCSGCEINSTSLRGFAEKYNTLDLDGVQTGANGGAETSTEDKSDLQCCVRNKSVVKGGQNRIKMIQAYAENLNLKSFRKVHE